LKTTLPVVIGSLPAASLALSVMLLPACTSSVIGVIVSVGVVSVLFASTTVMLVVSGL